MSSPAHIRPQAILPLNGEEKVDGRLFEDDEEAGEVERWAEQKEEREELRNEAVTSATPSREPGAPWTKKEMPPSARRPARLKEEPSPRLKKKTARRLPRSYPRRKQREETPPEESNRTMRSICRNW